MSLQIAKGFRLPDESVTQTFAILAKRGAGKSYTASVMVEEMLEREFHPVVIDPLGVWWGLQSSASGKSAGYPITVLGGDHGDVPLEPTAGETIADFVVDHAQPVVMDLSRFRKADQVRFTTQFAERLYQKNRDPLHLVVDEADLFAPQRAPQGYEARCLGAMEDLARRGRARGIGMTLVTQRSAVLNKNVLTQIEVLIVMRTTSPQDRAAIKAWVDVHGEEEKWRHMENALPRLPIGTAYIWSPGWLDVFDKVGIRTRRTFDSSATPKVGERRIEPKRRAQPDLDALKDRIASTIEKAKKEDPRFLRQRISELEAQAAQQEPEVKEVEVEVEVPFIPESVKVVVEKVRGALDSIGAELDEIESEMKGIEARPARPRSDFLPPRKAERKVQPQLQVPPAARAQAQAEGDAKLGRAPMALLTVLVQRHPMKVTRAQLSTLSGYKPKSSTYANALSTLRVNGLIEEEGSGKSALFSPSQAGFDLIGEAPSAPQSPEELQAQWLANLPQAPRTLLSYLIDVYPSSSTRETLASATEYSVTSSTFANALSTLRTNGLIEDIPGKEVRASDTLFA